MNVTAFVRQTATTKKKATIYIRVRDNDTKTDIKAATELSINPAYWDADRQGYKSRVTMVRDEERRILNDAVHDLCRTVSQEYFKGATSDWLKRPSSASTIRTRTSSHRLLCRKQGFQSWWRNISRTRTSTSGKPLR